MFVGMDVHKNYLQVAVLDEKEKVLNNSRVDNNLIKVNEFFDRLHPRSNTKVVMESSGMWYNIYEYLSKRHLEVRLSNPAKTRAIASAKIKTDKLDAVKLADLLRGAYIAAKKINTSMNLDEDLLKWVDSQITKKRFAHRTHAVEYALQKLKEESK
jgi:transposase